MTAQRRLEVARNLFNDETEKPKSSNLRPCRCDPEAFSGRYWNRLPKLYHGRYIRVYILLKPEPTTNGGSRRKPLEKVQSKRPETARGEAREEGPGGPGPRPGEEGPEEAPAGRRGRRGAQQLAV